jgi:hypothetical protein
MECQTANAVKVKEIGLLVLWIFHLVLVPILNHGQKNMEV